MPATIDADVLVVGAGVVGLACARALQAAGRAVILVERHERFGAETSSRNSEVVHAGLHYAPGTLKAILCTAGNRSTYAWCESHAVPYRRTGKLIVATDAAEDDRLTAIRTNAAANGVALEPLTPAQVRALEPHVRCTAALWSRDTGIVDSHALMASLLAAFETAGGTAAWRHTVTAARRCGAGYEVVVRDSGGEDATLTVAAVVNSAGLDADRVAALPGLDVDACGYRLHYARGHYFRLAPRHAGLVSRLVYPVPGAAGLGVHATVDLAGGIKLGPDVEYLAERRQDYIVRPELARDFHAAASRFLEVIELHDLAPDQAGIRPKLQAPGEHVRDFVIAEEAARGLPGWVNLVGIDSPGLTCALEIARVVAEKLARL